MKTPVFCTCADCGEQWSAAIDTVEMDEIDIAEARGWL